MSTQNEDETDTLGQDEPNSAPSTKRISNQSPSPVTQRTSNQSPSPANQCTANQSHAAATQRTSDQSSKSSPPSSVTLPENTKLDNQRQSEKEKDQCSIQREQHKPEKR